jgi:predicted nucleic acid-binding protein
MTKWSLPRAWWIPNILLRMTRRADPQHQLADTALSYLAGQGTILYYTHQNIAELWNAMTRPLDRNGFGLTVADAEREVKAVEAGMVFLPDNEAVYREWRRIVLQNGVQGVQVHDARLAAAMYAHRLGHILTLNVSDFTRFSGLTAVHPNSLQIPK